MNAIHGSDSDENLKIEADFHFSKLRKILKNVIKTTIAFK